jgi:hypothetical protein
MPARESKKIDTQYTKNPSPILELDSVRPASVSAPEVIMEAPTIAVS